jgi:parallel beta-helix repeat protein
MKKVFSGIMLTLLLTGLLVLAFNLQIVKASDTTIYIRPNGDVDPPTAPIQRVGDVYTFWADIYFYSLVVERDNIVVDGDYYMLQGIGGGNGVTLSGRSNVTIRNIEIKAFSSGIVLSGSSNSSIVGNKMTNNGGNGIDLPASSYNSIVGNKMTNNAGQGVHLSGSSSHNSIVGNNITNNGGHGVFIYSGWSSCWYNSIAGNSIINNGGHGIYLQAISYPSSSSYNSIVRNSIANNGEHGIRIEGIPGASGDSSYNSIVGNKIANNTYGINLLGPCPHNFIYYNDFVNNTHQVYTDIGLVNVWDNGYPSGGNYWSNYTGIDLYKGRYQNITGSDGIGDTPHIIEPNNQDRYPFMNQTGWWNHTELDFSLTPSPAYVGQTVTMLGNLIDMLSHPINNAKVDVYVNETFSASLFTNSSGWFKASAKVDTPETYALKVVYSGSATYKQSNHIETLEVYPKVDTKVSFTLSPNPAAVGQTITMLGNLTDTSNNTIENAPLEVYLKIGAGSWQYTATIYTNSTGWFAVSGKVTSTGTYQIAVLYRGSYEYNLSYRIETLIVSP